MNPSVYPMTPSVWRTRTRSGSSSSQGDRSASSSCQASPITGTGRKHVRRPGLQASQERVQIPPQNQVEELRKSFYSQLVLRLANVSAQLSSPPSPTSGTSNCIYHEPERLWQVPFSISCMCCALTTLAADGSGMTAEIASLLVMVRSPLCLLLVSSPLRGHRSFGCNCRYPRPSRRAPRSNQIARTTLRHSGATSSRTWRPGTASS
jgi:hypothetical protein